MLVGVSGCASETTSRLMWRRERSHSSFCPSRTAPTRRIRAERFGKLPTTSSTAPTTASTTTSMELHSVSTRAGQFHTVLVAAIRAHCSKSPRAARTWHPPDRRRRTMHQPCGAADLRTAQTWGLLFDHVRISAMPIVCFGSSRSLVSGDHDQGIGAKRRCAGMLADHLG